jgi:hypothetical protein
VLDALWRRLEIGKTTKRLLKGRRLDPSAERVSTYFKTEDTDEAVARDEFGQVVPAEQATGGHKWRGFRSFGKSNDHRDDLPQVVIGMAVTRTGIPVRVWSWPGATGDSTLIRQVKDDMRDWTLSRIVRVADRGFASQKNRLHLRTADHHYIIGEKLRSGSAEAKDALARQGRYQDVRDNLKGQTSPDPRGRTVHHLLQPRGRRTRRPCPRAAGRPAHRPDRRHRHPQRDQAGRATRGDLHQARPEPLPASRSLLPHVR